MSESTPQSWSIGRAGISPRTINRRSSFTAICSAGGGTIALVTEGSGRTGARVSLIATAPKLLEACTRLLRFAESVRPGGGVLAGEREMFEAARAAIAEATDARETRRLPSTRPGDRV